MSNYQIACGMYAFTQPLRDAWQSLFKPLGGILNLLTSSTSVGKIEVSFNSAAEAYNSPMLLLGHTCGYPYLKRWQHSHRLVCVPEYDIHGCIAGKYSSWFVTNRENPATNLLDFKGQSVALNALDSNSGMNVLRYALRTHVSGENYFDQIMVTGRHIDSLRAVADEKAALAAIDAISYFHIVDNEPELLDAIRIVGQSDHTMGLPFITPRDQNTSDSILTLGLNHCLELLSKEQRQCLKIVKFSEVSDLDYQRISALESEAIESGYPTLC